MMSLVRELSEWKRNAGITLTTILTSVEIRLAGWLDSAVEMGMPR